MAATDSASELQTSGGDNADLAIATIILENSTGLRMQALTAGPGVRGNATILSTKIDDIQPEASAQWMVVPMRPNDPVGYVIVQMAYVIVDRPVISDCPTVGYEWTCSQDGEQELVIEVNDDDDAFEGSYDKIEEDGAPKYVFTVRRTA